VVETQPFPQEHDDVASAAVSVESEDLPKSPVLLERCILEDDRPADVEAGFMGEDTKMMGPKSSKNVHLAKNSGIS
jgi:hypothetical protein